MITYSSYVGDDDNLAVYGGVIVVTNTLIGVLAGLVVFPILFANGIDPATEGPSAIFIAMASGFAELPAGRLLGVVFFAVVLIAALSSAISLLEVVVSWATDNYGIPRTQLAAAMGLGLFVLGLPSAWDTAWLTWFDNLAYQLLLPLSVLFAMLFVGWVLGDEALDEIRQGMSGMDWFGPTWLWTVRLVVIVGVLATLGLGFWTLFVDGAIVPPL